MSATQKANIDLNDLWGSLAKISHESHPTPTFLSGYQIRQKYNVFLETIKAHVKSGFIRTDGGSPEKYAEEDVIMLEKIRSGFKRLEDEKVITDSVVKGKKRYLIATSYKSYEDKVNIFQNVFNSILGDQYKVNIEKIDEK